MDDINSLLVDRSFWFLENKDSVRKEIVIFEKNVESFIVNYKNNVKNFTIKTNS